jgi:FKBP12-rapamycin complex-associated protein
LLLSKGEQAIVSGTEMKKWIDELFPIILDAIQDSSSHQKREVALWTLGRLVENSGYVVEPYWKYPNLLDILFSLLKSESTQNSQLIRRETIRVLGLIGAVDPYRHKVNLGVIDQSGDPLIAHDPIVDQGLNHSNF